MHTSSFSHKERFNIGLSAGLVAGIVASGLMLLLSTTFGGVSLPDILGSTVTRLISAATFETLHRLLGADAKYYLFFIIVIGQCLVFALIGASCTLLLGHPRFARASNEQGQLSWSVALILAAVLWLLVGFIFLPLNSAGIFGAQLATGIGNTLLSLAVVGLTFSLFFIYIQHKLIQRRLQKQGVAANVSRRGLLRNGMIALGLGTLGVLTWRFISGGVDGLLTSGSHAASNLTQRFKNRISPPPTPKYGDLHTASQLSGEVTSNEQFYLVSKNFLSDPTVDVKAWHLRIYGAVNHPYSLNYEQLLALPMKQQYETLMCISNTVGGEYMSNAQWEGITLKDLLERAGGTKAGASKVVLHAADDYSDSIHLSKALEPTTLVAVRMNGVPLPNGHGFPARLLVPGIYGMKHVKWLTGIEIVNIDYRGFWQQRGWSDPAPIRMTSRIDTPLSNTTLTANQPTVITGIAFSGDKGISEVNVTIDNGQTWQAATLKRPFSQLSWVLWELPWQPKVGTDTIIVRAIDMEGNIQDPTEALPAPDGSSGYHTISIMVK